jgi:3-oxoacyl-[acyl-carrier protein] reductase
MDLHLQDKVILVAASSKGLGAGIARACALEGAHLALCSRDAKAAANQAAQLKAETGAQAIGVACDVSDPGQIQAWVDQAVTQWGRIDGLVTNAGGPKAGHAIDLTDADWQDAFNSLLLSVIRMVRTCLPHMASGSAILTITSSTVREPIERLALSTVMRAGVAGLVKTLADELGPKGIRINNLLPGRIATDRVLHLDQLAAEKSGRALEAVQAESIAKIPLGRLGQPDEFGRAATFLLSPAAAYITGAMLRVDGGAMRSI